MNRFEPEYQNLLTHALIYGDIKENRTGVNTWSLFNQNLNIDVSRGFPILTAKKILFDKGLAEYNWIAQGLTHLTYLHRHGIKWWDEYADKNGYLGKTYGYQLRSFNGEVDQLATVYNEIRNNTRRAHCTFWNPSELNQTVLPPCYTGMTFRRVGDTLDMTMQLRSSDLFLGLPYDIIVGALFLIDTAAFCDLLPSKLGIQITDAHVYDNHYKQVQEYIGRGTYDLPYLSENPNERHLIGYKHKPHIYAKLNN